MPGTALIRRAGVDAGQPCLDRTNVRFAITASGGFRVVMFVDALLGEFVVCAAGIGPPK